MTGSAPSRPGTGLLEFRILGPLEVEVDGAQLSLGGQKQRALLALLLIHAREVLSTDRLVDELWGEHPPRTATTSLQNFVAQLRKVLPPDVLVTRQPGYVLQVGADQIDAGRFERLLGEARGQSAEQRAQLLREGLALWRGPPLADFAFERFAKTETRRLEELRVELLEERIDAELELGGGRELVAELEGLVAEYPLRERLRGQLMLALYRSDRQADALQAYHDARHALVEELGIEPGSGLHQLYRSILRQESTLERAAGPQRRIDDHFGDVAKALLAGRLVTVLGSGVNQLEEPCDGSLPASDEVAAHLARVFECPSEHARDLAHVAEYVAVAKGAGPLYDELHVLFDRDCAPGPAHRALASLAVHLTARNLPPQLLLTTNFDQLLEQAFEDAGERLDVVLYLALGRHRGKFLHLMSEGNGTVVDLPNAYTELAPDQTTVLFKIHGGIDPRPERDWESFVVSEDDHIDYLAQADISVVLPVTLAARLRRSHFLFLGYPLEQWSLRVFLHRLFGREKVAYRSWAIGQEPDEIELELWRQRGIDVFDIPLDDYLARLQSRVEAEAG
jgi:DNA-binding SARP family transcriptional activator